MPTTLVKAIKLALEGNELKRKNAKLSKQTTDIEAKLVEVPAVKSAMLGQL